MDDLTANIRIQYAYRLQLNREDACKMFVHNIMSKFECAKLKKNVQSALLYKRKAFSKFTGNAYKDAVKYYTKSLQLIPYNTDKEGIIFMMRSICLEKLEAYKEAIMDAQRALRRPVSEDLKKELNTRIISLQLKLTEQLNTQKSTEKFHEDLPTVTYGENSEIPGASSALILSKDNKNIRHLTTIRPVKAGDVLLVQKPFVVILDELEKNSVFNCHNCLEHCLAPIPCISCARTLYCSVKCRNIAYDNHKYECDVSAYKGVEFTAILRKMIAIANQGRGADGGLVAKCRRAIDSLELLVLTDKEEDESDHEKHYFASFMAVFLKTKTDMVGDDDIYDLIKVILRLMYLFQTNAVGIKCCLENKIPGIAVYPVCSLLQCFNSNTISYTHGTTVKVLRASRDIAEGEEIVENNYAIISEKTVVQIGGASLVKELHTLRSYNTNSDDDSSISVEKLKIPLHLQRRLRKSPTDIRYMWELLNFIMANRENPRYEMDYMKMFLEDAYMGYENSWLRRFYEQIGLW